LTKLRSGTAVAHGAVLRALRKEDGPARIVQSSYGFLRTEPHEPEVWNAHQNIRAWYDKVDGQMYVKDTIDWLITKVSHVPSKMSLVDQINQLGHRILSFLPFKNFPLWLYVSDHSYESHYRKDHPKNKGMQCNSDPSKKNHPWDSHANRAVLLRRRYCRSYCRRHDIS
jgi:hypothetical protein